MAVLDNLDKASVYELELYADALLNREFAQIGSEKAPFIWAALSLYWAQWPAKSPGKARAEYGEHRQFCPVCGSIPVSSVVAIGTQNVYVICTATCVKASGMWSESNAVTVTSQDLNYWSLDSELAAVKAKQVIAALT